MPPGPQSHADSVSACDWRAGGEIPLDNKILLLHRSRISARSEHGNGPEQGHKTPKDLFTANTRKVSRARPPSEARIVICIKNCIYDDSGRFRSRNLHLNQGDCISITISPDLGGVITSGHIATYRISPRPPLDPVFDVDHDSGL